MDETVWVKPPAEQKTAYWKVYEEEDGWVWLLVAANGSVLARSVGWYASAYRTHQAIGEMRHALREIEASITDD